jgi:hypothetical protein
MSFGLTRGRLRLGAELSGAIVSVLARLFDLGLQFGLAFRGGSSDAELGVLDLR